MKTTIDYWLTIEPYIHINIVKGSALLYNTLDGSTIESDKNEIIILLQKILEEENCGVVLLYSDQYAQKNIHDFIRELKEKYMGDIIDTSQSKGKPVQMLPYINYRHKINKKYNFPALENILDTLCEITIHVDHASNVENLIAFLQSTPENLILNIKYNENGTVNHDELWSFINQYYSLKNIIYSYDNILIVKQVKNTNFHHKIVVKSPIDTKQLVEVINLFANEKNSPEYLFDVASSEDYQRVEEIVVRHQIEKYSLNPVFTGDNIAFFEENVFLTKEDILSVPVSIKDFFFKQNMNTYDFGKINIMPNGDLYANINYPVLGNIQTHSIFEIVRKEIEEGGSWLRVRNQEPCSNCIFQWICPSPSDYERVIGRPNLCHVKKELIK